VLEKDGTQFETIDSKMIIDCGVKQKDPLCMKVVEKFTELFGVETGNFALKTLPYGGIYLIGGVTSGISDYLIHSDTFIKNFFMKGRLSEKMRKFPVYMVKSETNVGLLGAEECAYRVMRKIRG
jgi:glucokinase